jgi:integrase
MPKSSKSARARKPGDRPKKPYPDFPLTPHASGAWQKKIRGKTYYFGKWARRVNGKLERIEGDGWKEALEEYKVQADDLHAGRTPRVSGDGLTLAGLCNHFLTAKLRKKDAGEIGERVFAEYKNITDLLVSTFGANRLVDDLAADDFAQLRAAMVRRWGPVRMVTETVRVKSVFKYGLDNGLIEKAIRYGSEFKPPSRSVLRRHRAKSGTKMLEAEELRTLIDGGLVVGETGPELARPSATLRAMILLGINAGLGNTDCAALALSHLDLKSGWLDYPRPKTGVARRCPLWPETVDALRVVIDNRPEPTGFPDCGLVFLTRFGNGWGKDGHAYAIKLEFGKLLRRLKLYRKGLGFYTLRHVFRTVADTARDPVAIDLIMGHADSSMGAVYRERVDDSRLEAVVKVVRDWLWPKPTEAKK